MWVSITTCWVMAQGSLLVGKGESCVFIHTETKYYCHKYVMNKKILIDSYSQSCDNCCLNRYAQKKHNYCNNETATGFSQSSTSSASMTLISEPLLFSFHL
jgi:hypothetical protein